MCFLCPCRPASIYLGRLPATWQPRLLPLTPTRNGWRALLHRVLGDRALRFSETQYRIRRCGSLTLFSRLCVLHFERAMRAATHVCETVQALDGVEKADALGARGQWLLLDHLAQGPSSYYSAAIFNLCHMFSDEVRSPVTPLPDRNGKGERGNFARLVASVYFLTGAMASTKSDAGASAWRWG
jgi:hypothetical protein